MKLFRSLVAPLRVRISLVFGAIALSIYLLSGASLFQSIAAQNENLKREDLQAEIDGINSIIIVGIQSGQTWQDIWGNIELFHSSNVDVVAFDSTGEFVGNTNEGLIVDDAAARQVYADSQNPAKLSVKEGFYHSTFGNYWVTTSAVYTGEELAGVVQVYTSAEQTRRLVRDLAPRLYLGTFLMMLTVIGAGLFLSGNITRMVGRIESAANDIAEGDFSRRIDVISSDEVGQLANTINEMARRLQELSNAQAEFISKVSHELRTPLTSLKLAAQLLLKKDPREDQIRFMQILDQQITHLQHLVDDLLLLSRIDGERFGLNIEKLDLVNLSRIIVNGMNAQAKKKDIQLSLAISEEPIYADADLSRLQQVLVNLINNGIKFTEAGGEVSLLLFQKNGIVEIIVQDNGRGIPAQKLPHIFERFYQVEGDNRGVGLGLAVAEEIVKAHGWQISAKSKEGVGSNFTITIPPSGNSHPGESSA